MLVGSRQTVSGLEHLTAGSIQAKVDPILEHYVKSSLEISHHPDPLENLQLEEQKNLVVQ